jgi:hypothetical protein
MASFNCVLGMMAFPLGSKMGGALHDWPLFPGRSSLLSSVRVFIICLDGSGGYRSQTSLGL